MLKQVIDMCKAFEVEVFAKLYTSYTVCHYKTSPVYFLAWYYG